MCEQVRFLHVKGHSNHQWNDRADTLANLGASGQRSTAKHHLSSCMMPAGPEKVVVLRTITKEEIEQLGRKRALHVGEDEEDERNKAAQKARLEITHQ